jgi:hypothetical protein
MICTQAFGLRYLWVDRFCIGQSSTIKHTIIQSIDQIYRDASVTINNAVGDTSHCDMPGVSNMPRRLQKVANIHGVYLAAVPAIKREIADSIYGQREEGRNPGVLFQA